ncbi:histone H1-II [Nasonia vitripennis]|uniref:H15 domain-containing protein n=1 Tax=Nasonia vitripennis TaxID=7425 RepID=A0A7M7LNB5_NASVI|nr:histone H1-II [Nasonia vitripennis]
MASTTGLPSGAAKKPRSKPSHPRTSDMVDAAIKSLKERGGSSLQAIKKYIAATYKLDAEKLSPFIKKYLKSGVVAKKLVQTKGKGAAGSFKLSVGSAAGEKKASVASSAGKRKKSPTKKKPATAAVKKAAKKSPIKPKKSLPAKPPKPKLSKRAAGRKPAAKK